MKTLLVVLMAGALAVAGCGEDEETAPPVADEPAMETPAPTVEEATATATPSPAAKSVSIVVDGSEFGRMLFDSDKQAIYIFEKDGKGDSVCYDECAEAWPPVLGEPEAGDGVDSELLGTTKRKDGKLQVTYDGQPLYYYAHEKPGEVRCHNVNLNGGLWWAVGPDGKRLP